MNNLSLKLLQRFNQQNNNQGFTLIELLVVIIIIGILSAIGLATFLNLVTKAKETEPRLKINGANKNQWSYYIENNEFTDNLEILELTNQTENYGYEMLNNPLIPPELSIILATPEDATLRYYIGIIYIEDESNVYRRICKAFPQDFIINILPKFLDGKLSNSEINELDSKYCGSK